jgi:BirA family biotin operon repressor/biotin-[acetyl-CoA-carboxylase] ligase
VTGSAPVRAERWEGATPDELAGRWGMPAVHLFQQVGSTNDVARALADGGAPAGTVVIAEEQVAGRGRGGKEWKSPPGLGIWMTVVLRPAALPAPGLLPVLVGLAAAEALDEYVRPTGAQVKWPNDVHIAGRKVAGILCEGAWEADRPGAVVAGIGINAGHTLGDFPPELQATATSIRIAAGWAPPRAEVAGAIARAILRLAAHPPAQLGGALLEALAARDALQGREVVVTGATPVRGIALGISPAGALLVRSEEGALRTVRTGTVRLAGQAGG